MQHAAAILLLRSLHARKHEAYQDRFHMHMHTLIVAYGLCICRCQLASACPTDPAPLDVCYLFVCSPSCLYLCCTQKTSVQSECSHKHVRRHEDMHLRMTGKAAYLGDGMCPIFDKHRVMSTIYPINQTMMISDRPYFPADGMAVPTRTSASPDDPLEQLS